MNFFSVDLSLRSTGLAYVVDEKLVGFHLVSNKSLKDEALIFNNVDLICRWVDSHKTGPSVVRIEGLSFGSKSASIDLIAGQHWLLRVELLKRFKDITIDVIPVTSWRSPLFDKDERKRIQDAKKALATSKKNTKGLKGIDRQVAMVENKELEIAACIKEATWMKLDDEIQDKVLEYLHINDLPREAKYDITDAIMLGFFSGEKKEKKPKVKKKK